MPGTTYVSGTIGLRDPKDSADSPGAKADSAITPISGARPPNQYDEYEDRMRISNEDGLDRQVANIRELLWRNFVDLLQEGYASETEDLSRDETLRRALKLFAYEFDKSMDPGQFVKGILRVLRMDMNVLVSTRNSKCVRL